MHHTNWAIYTNPLLVFLTDTPLSDQLAGKKKQFKKPCCLSAKQYEKKIKSKKSSSKKKAQRHTIRDWMNEPTNERTEKRGSARANKTVTHILYNTREIPKFCLFFFLLLFHVSHSHSFNHLLLFTNTNTHMYAQ